MQIVTLDDIDLSWADDTQPIQIPGRSRQPLYDFVLQRLVNMNHFGYRSVVICTRDMSRTSFAGDGKVDNLVELARAIHYFSLQTRCVDKVTVLFFSRYDDSNLFRQLV